MKKVKYTKYIPPVPENQILRVPPNKESYLKAYDMIKAATDFEFPKEDFDTFYNNTDSLYLVTKDGHVYNAAGWIRHGECEMTPYKFRGNHCYMIQCASFYCGIDYYLAYSLIKTLIKDKNDRVIYVDTIDRETANKNLVNAYVNNRFKWQDATHLYHLPDVIEGNNREDELQEIDPDKEDDKVIDKYVGYCNEPDIAGAQQKYMADLKAKVAAENIPYATSGYMQIEGDDTGCSWEEATCTCTCTKNN